MRTPLLAALALAFTPLVFATAAHAASLRANTTLSDPAVRLSDLWDGVEADRAIGPGPEPGGRIVVEAPQLAAIARQFGVDWRPSSSGERIVLERPGKPLPRDVAMAALRAALAVRGVPSDAEIEMPAFAPPTVPADGETHTDVAQLDYDAASGRFTAMLSATAKGMAPAHTRLSGSVVEMLEVPVAARRLAPGDVIGAGDVKLARLRAATVRGDVARTPGQAIGQAMRRPVGPGAPLVLADMGRPLAVQRGDPVQMQLEAPGIAISAQGVAMDSGGVGESVHVLNVAARAVMDAEVLGAGRVRISGATPVLLPPGAPLPPRDASRDATRVASR